MAFNGLSLTGIANHSDCNIGVQRSPMCVLYNFESVLSPSSNKKELSERPLRIGLDSTRKVARKRPVCLTQKAGRF